jgi:hypothetical protein
MRTLTKEFGLSNVGLAKICEKHHIPRPPVGHWIRVERGYDPEQTPLPDIEDANLRSCVPCARGVSRLVDCVGRKKEILSRGDADIHAIVYYL